MTPTSVVLSRYDTVVREVTAGTSLFRLVTIKDSNTLVEAIDPETFAGDERFPYWADLWVSAVVLASRLPGPMAGLRVLELGCGLGLAGIAAARAGAEVTMTDYEPDALQFAAENVSRNLDPEEQKQVTVREMDWRAPALDGSYDLVIGADIVYERRFFVPLLTLLDRALRPGGKVLLTEPDRTVGQDFFALARSVGWTVMTEQVPYVWNGVAVTVNLNTLTPRENRSAGT
jgi:predicted nicotinamide N-methyase